MKKLIIITLSCLVLTCSAQRGIQIFPGAVIFTKTKFDSIRFSKEVKNQTDLNFSNLSLNRKRDTFTFTTDCKANAARVMFFLALTSVAVGDDLKFKITIDNRNYLVLDRDLNIWIKREIKPRKQS